ncbi:MAG: S-layer homology domain-containing protein, partial [Ruminiclostridium sp.]|nr:S-layer homology domain-containing protein [Ruminiclostridium sp.]
LTDAAILVPNGTGIDADDDLNIVLEGSSTVIGVGRNDAFGVYTDGDLAIRCGTNAGNLTVTGYAKSIYAAGSSLTIRDKGTAVTATGHWDGIGADNVVTISGGAVVTATGEESTGIYAGNGLVIRGEGTEVTASGDWRGMHIQNGDMTVSGGAVVTVTGESDHGIDVSGDTTIRDKGTAVTASGKESGINTYGDVTISGGAVVTATGEQRHGIGAYPSGGSVAIRDKGTVVTASGPWDGIGANKDVTISGGAVVEATGDDFAIYGGYEGITIRDKGTAVTASGHRDGIGADNIVTISGGAVVTATGEQRYGVYALNGLIVRGEGTEVTAIGGAQGQAVDGVLKTALSVREGADAATARPSTVDYSRGDYTSSRYVFIKGEPTVITVSFNANGGQCSFNIAVVGEDGTLAELPDAARVHHTFDGWYTAKTGGTRVTTDTVFTKSTTLYAHWTAIVPGEPLVPVDPVDPVDPIDPCAKFTDVDRGAWYHNAVDYVLVSGLMKGISPTLFAPDGNLSRAMLVTILWRITGEPVVNYALTFSDVPEGTWYTEAVRWAASEGIVKGYGDGTFGPNDPVTREQLATILYRYEQVVKGGGFTGDWEFPLNFSDADKVSPWAEEGMKWCVMEGIISGKGGGILDPQGYATRVEAAQMIMKYMQR